MPLTPQQKTILMRKAGDNPTMAFMELVRLMEEQINEKVEEKMQNMANNMPEMTMMKHIHSLMGEKGEKGDKGDKGKDGYTPKKYIDYFDGIDGKKGDKGEKGKDGLDGLNGRNGIDGANGKDGKDGSPDKPLEIADKLNKTEESVNLNVIKGLTNFLKNLQRAIKEKSGGLSRGGGDIMYYSDLTSQCNGVLKTFTIPKFRKAYKLESTQFPIVYRPLIDWTANGTTLTLTSEVGAPETNQTLLFYYIV